MEPIYYLVKKKNIRFFNSDCNGPFDDDDVEGNSVGREVSIDAADPSTQQWSSGLFENVAIAISDKDLDRSQSN